MVQANRKTTKAQYQCYTSKLRFDCSYQALEIDLPTLLQPKTSTSSRTPRQRIPRKPYRPTFPSMPNTHNPVLGPIEADQVPDLPRPKTPNPPNLCNPVPHLSQASLRALHGDLSELGLFDAFNHALGGRRHEVELDATYLDRLLCPQIKQMIFPRSLFMNAIRAFERASFLDFHAGVFRAIRSVLQSVSFLLALSYMTNSTSQRKRSSPSHTTSHGLPPY